MSQNHIECPICMDNVELNKNSVTTECGHCFHASCLMKNVAHNGFGCPYCRTAMAEEVEDDDRDSSDWSVESEEEEPYEDSALRGLRFFTDNLEGNQHDEEDVADEEEEQKNLIEERQARELQNQSVIKPSPSFIAEKLVEQGVTMEQLVKALLLSNHDGYDAEEEEFERVDDDLFGKFRIIISNYETHQTTETQQEQQQRTINYPNVTVRRPMRA